MRRRCPNHERLSRATLPGHRLVFRGVADVEAATGESVQGALYRITPQHLRSLDSFEGYPRLYIRKELIVVPQAGEPVRATLYQMTDRQWYAPPGCGYLQIVISGCRDWELPEEHIEALINRAQSPYKEELS